MRKGFARLVGLRAIPLSTFEMKLPLLPTPRTGVFLACALLGAITLLFSLFTKSPGKISPCSPVNPAWIYEMHPWSYLKANFSQGAQDMYLEKIFSVIGSTNKYFVEFGFNEESYDSGGSGANTAALYAKGWRGLLLDGSRRNKEINLHKRLLFASNIAGIFAKYGVPKDLDYLSCDMDSHDLWVFRAILEAGYRPRVITTEYNSNYPLSVSLTLIDPSLVGDGSTPTEFAFAGCAWGASATALGKVAKAHGYRLIGRIQELDLVWLREDLLHDCFLLPEFEWFFRNGALGLLCHPAQTSTKFVDQLVDYDTFVRTRDFKESNKVARAVLKTANLPCFEAVRSSL